MAMEVEKVNSNVISPNENDTKGEPKNFYCKFPGCFLSYSRQWKLDRHVCSHTGERPFKCQTAGCEKMYRTNSHLQRHVKYSHSVVDMLPCMFESCKVTFKTKEALTKHIRNHGRSKKFQCPICLVWFITEKRLATHKLEHMGVLPFACQLCKLQFPNGARLRQHMKFHKAIPCEYQGCNKILNSHLDLRKHLAREHRSSYSCEHCQRSFNNKGILRDHVLIHLPPEARGVLACPHKPCKRVYFQKRNLTHHIKVFHNTPRFYCSVPNCNKSCLSEEMLKRHAVRKHKALSEEHKLQIINNLVNITPIEEKLETIDQPPQFEFFVISHDHM